MKNIIIGTAGHIDHGKSSLIKAMTGRETDKLKEEKERGISIELGFTHFDLPSGKRVGIIDVPGHERFIRNMIAGITGIDMVILVVAADEGMMPQTKEHLNILNLLGVKNGIIAVTKTDMVDREWIDMIIEDIREDVKGTFLEKSTIVPVSSVKKIGLEELSEEIDKMVKKIDEKDSKDTPRLPIDRIFSITGFGTVVTGTLISGVFTEGDEIQAYPTEKTGRIRFIQVHGEEQKQGFAGQRVALNITNVSKSDLRRGHVLAPVGSMKSSKLIDVKLKLLNDSPRIMENRMRVRLYIGSSEILCRVVLLNKKELTPGEEAYAQLRLEEPIVSKRGDKFIIRFYSPMITIGGGEILNSNPQKKKSFDQDVIKELELKEKGNIDDIIEELIWEKSEEYPSLKEITRITAMLEEEVREIILKIGNEKIQTFKLSNEQYMIHKKYELQEIDKIVEEIKNYHEKYPLRPGISKEEIRSKFFNKAKQKVSDIFLDNMVAYKVIKTNDDKISLIDFMVVYNERSDEIKKDILREYREAKNSVLKEEELFKKLDKEYNKKDDRKTMEHVLEALLEEKKLIKIRESIVLHSDCFEESKEKIIDFLKENQEITIGEMRTLLNSNRKVSMAIGETLDDMKITKRIEDKRVLNL